MHFILVMITAAGVSFSPMPNEGTCLNALSEIEFVEPDDFIAAYCNTESRNIESQSTHGWVRGL